MRDRGITNAGMKAAGAAVLVMVGTVAVTWGVWNLPEQAGEPSAAVAARNMGLVALVVGVLAMANYLYALSLVRKMQRGEGVIGKWTVAPATFARFRDAERASRKRKNNWRLPRRISPDGLPVIFSSDAVLVGHSWFRLASKGLSRFTYVRIAQGAVPSIEFSMTLTAHGAGPLHQRARYRGHLRLPISENAGGEAARVVSHFQRMVSS